MAELSEQPLYLFVTCGQRTPDPRERADWEHTVRALVRNGSRVIHYLTPDTSAEETAFARALVEESPQCDWMPIVRSEVQKLNLDRFHYVIAWEGEIEAPRQALVWIERAREGDAAHIDAALYDAETLRRDREMLLRTAGAFDAATYVTDDEHTTHG